MAISETSDKLTYEDYAAIPNDGKRYEIIDGELYVNPSPITRHERIAAEIEYLLRTYVRVLRSGEVFDAPYDVVLSDSDIVQPDVLYVANLRRHIVTDKNIQGAPDLVVEVLSESSRRLDLIIKRQLYERYGVTEYWIADPTVDTVIVYRRIGEKFVRFAKLTAEANDILESPLFPTLTINLRELFATQ
jgi:Uma2 family endonuclease